MAQRDAAARDLPPEPGGDYADFKDCGAELRVSVTNAKVLQHRAMRLAAQINDEDAP